MQKKITIYDIAKKLGVTAATVSRALNGNTRISAPTREKILKAAEEMNYRPNRLALALKSGRSQHVGIIVPRIDRNFFATVIQGIEDTLYPHGYQVIISQTYDSRKREIEAIETLLHTQVDGILMSISDAATDGAEIQRILPKKVPLIFFDRKKDLPGVNSVVVNDFEGGYIATAHLAEMGYTKIAHLAGDRSLEIYRDRFEGYKKALADHGLPFDPDYVCEGSRLIAAGRQAVDALLALPVPPDALFSSSDYGALGALQRLGEHGIEVPDAMGVVGFSNEPFTEYLERAISSVDQSPYTMGEIAAKVLLDRLGGQKEGVAKATAKAVVLSPKLCVRASSLRKLPENS